MNHIMIDIETLGLSTGSVILSLGAVVFDPFKEKTGTRFSYNINLESSLKAGLTINANTLQWWLSQNTVALKELFVNTYSLNAVLDAFIDYYKEINAVGIWSHGASFDVPLLTSCYEICNKQIPWSYKHIYDTRTAFLIGGLDYSLEPKTLTEHIAVNDAIQQALAVQKALKRIIVVDND